MAFKPSADKLIGLILLLVFFIIAGYFFFSNALAKDTIPSYVTGETRLIYEWAKSSEGKAILEQIPCYCGCKFEGHKHARHCFWKDDGSFDRHGLNCSVCFDIAKKSKELHENGKSVCDIRKAIDDFYKPNKNLATSTPIPERCSE